MAARIVEYDFETKPKTRRVMKKMQEMVPDKWEKMMNRYWTKVYENTVMAITDMGAVDTGSLRQSIRIEKNKTIPIGSGFNYEVIRTDGDQSAYIIAGGGGVINPRHNREVDYAQIVHDGGPSTRRSKKALIKTNASRRKAGLSKLTSVDIASGSSGWVAARPFLDEGIQRTEPYLDKLLKDYMDDKENVWSSDQPISSPYNVSMWIKTSRY